MTAYIKYFPSCLCEGINSSPICDYGTVLWMELSMLHSNFAQTLPIANLSYRCPRIGKAGFRTTPLKNSVGDRKPWARLTSVEESMYTACLWCSVCMRLPLHGVHLKSKPEETSAKPKVQYRRYFVLMKGIQITSLVCLNRTLEQLVISEQGTC